MTEISEFENILRRYGINSAAELAGFLKTLNAETKADFMLELLDLLYKKPEPESH